MISKKKAGEMLKHGKVHGKSLTDKQKGLDNSPIIIPTAMTIAVNKGTETLSSEWDLSGHLVLGSLTIKAQDGSDNNLYDNGTATSGGATTLTDTGKSWTTNFWANAQVAIVRGTGVGQYRTISSNTATALTVSSSWTTNPNSTSKYIIVFPKIDGAGTVASLINVSSMDNVNMYGFWLNNFTNYAHIFTSCGGWNILYNMITSTAGYGIGMYYSKAIYGWNYLDVANFAIRPTDSSSLNTYDCCVKRNGSSGTGYGTYVDRGGIGSLSSGNPNTYINWQYGILAAVGGIVESGSWQVFSGCTTNYSPVGASDPAYVT